ncbi:MAG TPA: hypothetical protein VGI65_01960 [Steroidobacteraceae bacterium]|jgi:hypothetical protein
MARTAFHSSAAQVRNASSAISNRSRAVNARKNAVIMFLRYLSVGWTAKLQTDSVFIVGQALDVDHLRPGVNVVARLYEHYTIMRLPFSMSDYARSEAADILNRDVLGKPTPGRALKAPRKIHSHPMC